MKALFVKTTDIPHLQSHIEAPGVCIVQGEQGYRPMVRIAEATDELIFTLNENTVLPEEVVRSAVNGSMFGWDTPAAKEANDWFATRRDLADDIFPNSVELDELLARVMGRHGMGKK